MNSTCRLRSAVRAQPGPFACRRRRTGSTLLYAGLPCSTRDRLPGPGRQRRRLARSGLQTRFLVHAQHRLVRASFPRMQRADIPHPRAELGVPRHLGRQPQMLPPRLELVASENALHRLRRDRIHDSIADQLSGQLRAVPVRQGPTHHTRSFAGYLDQRQRYFGGERTGGRPVRLPSLRPATPWRPKRSIHLYRCRRCITTARPVVDTVAPPARSKMARARLVSPAATRVRRSTASSCCRCAAVTTTRHFRGFGMGSSLEALTSGRPACWKLVVRPSGPPGGPCYRHPYEWLLYSSLLLSVSANGGYARLESWRRRSSHPAALPQIFARVGCLGLP